MKEEVEQVDLELITVQNTAGAISIPKPTTFPSSPERHPRPLPQVPLRPSGFYTQFLSPSPQRREQQTNKRDFREQDAYKPSEDATALLSIDQIEQRLEPIAHDNGYLVMDSSITLQGGEPLTNSMLNGYLESKLMEVYTQYLHERLVQPGTSPGWSLLTPLVPPGYVVQRLSQQVALEQGLEVDEACSMVLSYMHTHGGDSRAVSSHFSSPVLRISKPE